MLRSDVLAAFIKSVKTSIKVKSLSMLTAVNILLKTLLIVEKYSALFTSLTSLILV